MSPFDKAIQIVLSREGQHNVDEGGDTWFGIARKFHPTETPWPPTKERAIQIYRTEYWDHNSLEYLPPLLAVALFDAVVNQGEAVRNFQRALRVTPDGVVGPDTITAAHRANQWETIAIFFAHRARRYVLYSNPDEHIGLLARLFRTHKDLLGLE